MGGGYYSLKVYRDPIGSNNKVVPIVRQGGSNCPTEFGQPGNWNRFLEQIGPLNTATQWSQFSK